MPRNTTQGKRRYQPRLAVRINSRLDRNLAAYAAVAGAAGVSMLAIAQPVQAKIVYTPANLTLKQGSTPLDLNNDGVSDFRFYLGGYGHALRLYILQQDEKNLVFNSATFNAAPLPFGARIGPTGAFKEDEDKAWFMAFWTEGLSGISSRSNGPWKQAQNRYLGLKFSVNGETHYGWARLTVNAKTGIVATLTGYAYETIPNKPIIAGKTSGPVVASAVDGERILPAPYQPATLGALARGADVLVVWRRDEHIVADDRSQARA
jgi:hypothetical protein